MTDDITARLEITETLNRYAWGYDTRDLEAIGNSFTVDGVFEVLLEGEAGWGPYEGRKVVVDWLAEVMETQNDQRRHCITNPVFVELNDARAVVDSYLLLTAVEAGKLQVVCTGTYRDEMSREEGVWRIRRKTLRLDNPF
jgi:hypothetical protein